MKTLRTIGLLSCFGILLAAFTPSAKASEFDKKTFVTFSEPVALPHGVVLPPGEYVMKTVVTPGSLNIVQITNKHETKVFTTVQANSIERMNARGKTMIAFREAPVGQPIPMDHWFYPGTLTGWEFPAKR